MTLISSFHWKTLIPFYLRKKTPGNTFLTLIVDYWKVVQENKLYIHIRWNAYCFQMEPVELPMAFFRMFCSPHDSPFPLMLPCWCSMHRVSTLFFDLQIYLPLHEQSNWYTPGCGSSFGLLFWQRIYCRFFDDVKAICFLIFLNLCFIFGLMFGIQGNFFRFLESRFSVLFS